MDNQSGKLFAIASLFVFVLFFGCAANAQTFQPSGQNQTEIIKTVYVCPDGSEASVKSDCVLPVIDCGNQTPSPGSNANVSQPSSQNSCGGANDASCKALFYCKKPAGSASGTCEKMVPVGLSLSPPGAYYDYAIGGAWTGNFSVLNTGTTPISLTFTSNSIYASVISGDSAYLVPGNRTTVRYRVHFDDANLPVGTNLLRISVSSPVQGFVVQDFKITAARAY